MEDEMRTFKVLAACVITLVLSAGIARATPSTYIWIPSPDIQPYKKFHFGFDTYIKTKSIDGTKEPTVTNLGLTAGVLPFEKIQMEVGIDVRDFGGTLDTTYPFLFNAKLGTPEDSLFKGSPALAVGGYDFGTKKNATNFNIVYGIAGKTIDKIGRFGVGYFTGNKKLLLDRDGNKDNHGILLAFDRTISEISDKLWFGIDYQGTKSSYGALSFGVSWKFAPNVSVIFGYDIYNEHRSYKPTTTIQLDIGF
jgi:hypothetical protein